VVSFKFQSFYPRKISPQNPRNRSFVRGQSRSVRFGEDNPGLLPVMKQRILERQAP